MITKVFAIVLLMVCVIHAKDKLTRYNIDVKTGNLQGAGTDGNVFVIIYGEKGDTGKIMLKSSQISGDKFERNRLDKFGVQARDVGKITKIRIGHDNRGVYPGWYLDKVVIINVKVKECKATFIAKRWVEKSTSLQTNLSPAPGYKKCYQDQLTTRYNIDVKTGNVQGAGTDGIVFIIIYGEKGDTGKLLLTSSQKSGDKFERNRLDKFGVKARDVGRITKIRIGHNNRGGYPGWYLDKVVVINVKDTKCKATFLAKQWVEKSTSLKINLSPVFDNKKCYQGKLTRYNVDVETGNVKSAGTDANVYIIIYGEKGDTGKIFLESSQTHRDKFEQNYLDKFGVYARDVGKITKIRIGHDNRGQYAGWYLNKVVIRVGDNKCEQLFIANRWLESSKSLQANLAGVFDKNTCYKGKLTTYNIRVKTGGKRSSGTDANVFVIIYGEKGDTGKLFLKKSGTYKDKFEAKHVDSFIKKAVPIGRITKIRIGHDNQGRYSGWYLDNVVIKVKSCTSTFPAWQWLERKKLAFDLYPTLEQGKCKAKTSTGSICRRDFRKIGCFSRDWDKVPDLLITDLDPTHKNYTTSMNWGNFALGLHSLACRCRAKAVGHYKYFGIGFNAECVAGKDSAALEKMFAAQKGATGCINGKRETCNKVAETECAGVEDFDFFYEIVE